MKTTQQLSLPRCPHCNTANPTIHRLGHHPMVPQKSSLIPFPGPGWVIQWHVYGCASCAGLVAAATVIDQRNSNSFIEGEVLWTVPELTALSPDIPQRAAKYLAQARETLSSPSASVVMSASAVDAMLKERGHKDGKLYARIGAAQAAGLLTEHMAEWAHNIRLDANDERHADDDADTTAVDAKRCLDFAETIAELLFVLPARVTRGRAVKPPAVAPH